MEQEQHGLGLGTAEEKGFIVPPTDARASSPASVASSVGPADVLQRSCLALAKTTKALDFMEEDDDRDPKPKPITFT
ncbi:hypothetical protein TRIUR3_20345 [Triticum urartu]|uniref:Uncharacterized protein n=1 Tax=Triticum urartu TaxID=4572 RepID=M7ZE52_TRIUA|nr:hypothetical protein TRIUR3_20345 [Triticum urartu]